MQAWSTSGSKVLVKDGWISFSTEIGEYQSQSGFDIIILNHDLSSTPFKMNDEQVTFLSFFRLFLCASAIFFCGDDDFEPPLFAIGYFDELGLIFLFDNRADLRTMLLDCVDICKTMKLSS